MIWILSIIISFVMFYILLYTRQTMDFFIKVKSDSSQNHVNTTMTTPSITIVNEIGIQNRSQNVEKITKINQYKVNALNYDPVKSITNTPLELPPRRVE